MESSKNSGIVIFIGFHDFYGHRHYLVKNYRGGEDTIMAEPLARATASLIVKNGGQIKEFLLEKMNYVDREITKKEILACKNAKLFSIKFV